MLDHNATEIHNAVNFAQHLILISNTVAKPKKSFAQYQNSMEMYRVYCC